MTDFFTSDPHYFHGNIIRYCKRPYKDVDEMHDAFIKNYNSKVQPNDTCYFLGDIGFAHPTKLKEVITRLNGQKVVIRGNHDPDKKILLGIGFGSAYDYLEIKVQDPEARQGLQRIVLFHYAMRVWNQSHRGAWQLYGHSHGTLPDDPNLLSMDVGVDPSKYFPLSYEEVKAHMKKKKYKPVDYHGEEKDQG